MRKGEALKELILI